MKSVDLLELGHGNFDPEGIEFDPKAMARAMMENGVVNASLLPRTHRVRIEQRECEKEAKLSLYHPTELIGRRFNNLVRSLKMNLRDQFNCCFYCGDELTLDISTKDHIYPESLGGTITVPCCKICNIRKKDMLFDEFRVRNFGKKFVFWGEGVIGRGSLHGTLLQTII